MRVYKATYKDRDGKKRKTAKWYADLATAGMNSMDKDGNEICSHSLCNSYIACLANGNTPPKVVQKLARHSDPRLTFNIYARTFEKAEQKAISFLPNFGNLVLSTCLDKMCRKQEISIDSQRHKNGQDALIIAFLADKQTPRVGLDSAKTNNLAVNQAFLLDSLYR